MTDLLTDLLEKERTEGQKEGRKEGKNYVVIESFFNGLIQKDTAAKMLKITVDQFMALARDYSGGKTTV